MADQSQSWKTRSAGPTHPTDSCDPMITAMSDVDCSMKSSDSSGGFYQDLAIRASSAAASLITPVVSWFGSWMSDSQPLHRRSTSSQVAESLLMEVIQQGRSLENQQNICRQMEMSTGRTVDYRYLLSYFGMLIHFTTIGQLLCSVAFASKNKGQGVQDTK